MNSKAIRNSTKFLVTLTFLGMVAVNALANILPINGQGTGEISDFYANLFAPAGLTFAIWGVIYLLLLVETLYQLELFAPVKTAASARLLEKVGIYFSISSIANTAWIFSWHYQIIALSMILMIIILGCLILINQTIKKESLAISEKFFIRLPFSVYFGWITVATIANATTLLVSLGWDGFGLPEVAWTVAIIVIGMLIGAATIVRNHDIAYGLVLIWAYAGILIKHTSDAGFAGQYPAVIYTTAACLVIFTAASLYTLLAKKGKQSGRA